MPAKFCGILVFVAIFLGTASTGWAAGLWLYEGGQPDVGTATAGRAANEATL